jgi:carbamoyl-phosphate synthase small subunit
MACPSARPGRSVGEVVFNTAMTGYQEILTDPSYARQIVTLTYPHIGNTGINPEDEESGAVHAAGLVIRDLPPLVSSWRSRESLPDYLSRHGVVAIAGIDTRRLTRILREKGAQNGCIMAGEMDEKAALEAARASPGSRAWISRRRSRPAKRTTGTRGPGSWAAMPRRPGRRPIRVVAYDYGVKRNILRMLVDRGCRVTVVPAQTRQEVLDMQPDGVFLSNGPGDPEPCDYAIAAIRDIVDAGMPTYRHLPGSPAAGSGQRRAHGEDEVRPPRRQPPGAGSGDGRVMISSQNHGFAVDEAPCPGT